MRAMRLAENQRVWVEADVYDMDFSDVHPGMTAAVEAPNVPGVVIPAHVEYMYPYVDDTARTGRVRLALDAMPVVLLPEMYVTAYLDMDLGDRLVVPLDAVVIAGDRRVVFVDHGGGRMEPRDVIVGRMTDEVAEVKSGLAAGERVAVSGNFLLAAESRLRYATTFWGGGAATAGGGHVHH
jgi:Cu(I)/Ag(I) efflux system membrane fusion protein